MVRREAGGDVGLHLAINRKTGDAEFLRRIRAEENRDAAVGEGFEDDLAVGGDLPGAGLGKFRIRRATFIDGFPAGDFLGGHVAELGVGEHFFEVGGADDGFPKRHGGNDRGAGVAGEFHDGCEFGWIDGRGVGAEVLDVAVEMVDRFLAALHGVDEADVGGDVASETDPNFVGGFGHGVVDFAFHAGVNFE